MQQINTPDGLFHDGAPSTGELGTIVSASWLNSVANELENVVTGLGGTLDPARDDQIKSLLTETFASKHDAVLTGTPVAPTAAAGTATDQLATTGFVSKAMSKNTGLPLLFPLWCPNRAAIPAGYAPADGQALSRSLYPDAWAGIAAGNVPVVTDAAWLATPTERGKFTAGDGATTFRLPDYNGKSAGSLGAVFMRGDGALSAGADGVIQPDELRSHVHTIPYGNLQFPISSSSGTSLAYAGGGQMTGTSSVGGAETRPLNVTGCWVIRLFGAAVNPGAADAAQLATEVSKLRSDKVPFAAFLGANQSLTVNGYQRLPGGMIIQLGKLTTTAGGVATWTYPISYPVRALGEVPGSPNAKVVIQGGAVDTPSQRSFNLVDSNSGAAIGAGVSFNVISIGI
ncbi:phage tail protein [Microvirgula aerodenitrificans]|uniref:phage tail protein n=1 Tax=Microvirgula aerodenitrificans TaxID=57480 RepID=UPI00048B3B23|nr:phage tail protein [Microvirgula aerodenitrificans]